MGGDLPRCIRRIMKRLTTLTLGLTSLTVAAVATAAAPGQVDASGKTLASSQLATDVLNKIVDYTRTSAGCATVDAVRMEVLPRSYVPRQPAVPATDRGGHFERWSVDACGARQQFQVGLWPSARGGSDFAVTPLSGRVTVTAAASAAAPAPQVSRASGPVAAWHGRYVWEESLGRTGGSSPSEGVASFVTYTLSLGPGQGATGCTLNASGFQTNTRMQCTATPTGSSLVIKFYKFGPDDVRGRHTRGERLLTLTRDASGVVTQLEGLQPASDSTPRRGRLFVKRS